MLSGALDFDLRRLINKIDNSSFGKGFIQQNIYYIQNSQLIALQFQFNIYKPSMVPFPILKFLHSHKTGIKLSNVCPNNDIKSTLSSLVIKLRKTIPQPPDIEQ